MPIEIDLLHIEGESDPRVVRAAVSGQLLETDVHRLGPQLDELLEHHASVRMLLQLSGFTGWSPGAAWEDARLAIRHYSDLDRIALVGDRRWEEWMARLARPFTTAEVRFFEPFDMDNALAWITEPSHPHIRISVEEDRRVVRLRPTGPLSSDDFSRLAEEVDPLIEKWGALNGLVIESRDFPGWESMGALIRHLSFVSDHHRSIRRIALVTDSRLGVVAENFAGHFVSAEIKQFGSRDLDVALQWAAKSGENVDEA